MKGVFGPAGTVIPRTGALLRETVIRGVASRGMLCSAYELGLGDDHEGIIELPDGAPVGQPYASYAGLGDTVFDIKVTPNRADCLGVRGIRNEPSPEWLRGRLEAIGLRPISALVDITNFVTFDLNRPLHVFDAGRVKGDLTVRLARSGETLLALNGQDYALDTEMTSIADKAGVQSLGGVIGGERTGCTETTTEVFIEAALFDPVR